MSPSSPGASPRRALLILNPAARRVQRLRDEAVRAFARAGVPCDVLETARPGHAADLAREHAARYDLVFTLGGDRTAIEVIGAVGASGPPVGVLPGGTGNLLARALGTPLAMADAVPALLNGRETRYDLGRLADGKAFAIGVGVGIDEAMIAGASTAMKQRLGFLAYFWSGTLAGLRLDRFDYRLSVDGKVYEGRAVSVLVMNLGSILGGQLSLGAAVRPDDGQLNVIVFEPRSVLDALRTFGRMMFGGVERDPCVTSIAARQVRLETTPLRRIQADGELLDQVPAEIVVQPGAARLLAPRRD